MKTNITLFFVFVFLSLIGAQEPDEFTKLQHAYDAAVDRAVRPLTETYLRELEKLKVASTQAADLDKAVRIDKEIQIVLDRLEALKADRAHVVKDVVVKDVDVAVPANTPNGYAIGPVQKGDRILLQYVTGTWKGNGTIASSNPDIIVVENHDDSLAIARAARKQEVPGKVLTTVSGPTTDKPFVFIVPDTRDDLVLRINHDSTRMRNPGSVTYHLKVIRPPQGRLLRRADAAP